MLNVAGMIVMWNLGSHWYPIALILLAPPGAWLGGVLARGAVRRPAGL